MKVVSGMDEIWRDVVGFEGAYEVSNLGRVRSLPGGGRRPRVLKQGKAGKPGNDYPQVFLTGQKPCKVHHLVAQAFIGPRPAGMVVCHANGDRFDSRVKNLRYDTQSNNMLDAIAHGTNTYSRRTHCRQGHEYTSENTSYEEPARAGMRRVCRACSREKTRRYEDRLKLQQTA